MAHYAYEEPRITRRNMVLDVAMVLNICVMIVSMILFIAYETRLNELNLILENYEIEIDTMKDQLNSYESKLHNNSKTIEDLTKANNELTVQSGELENTIRVFATSGKRPENYNVPKKVSRGSYGTYRDKLKYVGEWEGTCYTPSPDECNNSKGITYSGKPVEPGRTIAVDPKYWKLGTRFYIEGIGEVVATDIGSAVKGEKRFDWCLFDKTLAFTKGRFTAKVFLIED